MMTVAQAFPLALQHHKAGRLPEAEEIYRQILAAQPNNATALHLLGLVAYQVGRLDVSVKLIRDAIAANPTGFPFYLDLGNALRDRGQLDEAIAAYRRALELKPDFLEAHNNLGIAFKAVGRLDEAIASYRRALELKPDFPDALINLGNALRKLGRFEEAIAECRRALEFRPDSPEAWNNLGAALAEQGRLDEAIAAFRRALELKPTYAEAHSNLGATLAGQGQIEEALAACRRAVELNPRCAEAHNNLGNALKAHGAFDEAIAAYRHTVALQPGHFKAHSNLGLALAEQGLIDEAMAAYRRSLELKPNNPEALNNLGNALKDRGELDEAIAAYREALQRKPGDATVHSNLIYALHLHPGHDKRSIAEEHQRWNRSFSDPLNHCILPHANECNPNRRLRIGYVSPDFREHSAGRYVLPLMERHDRDQFEILCYSGVIRPDWMTERFRALAGRWRNTVGVSDARLVEMIREDGIDILVDLSQHTAGNRLPVFARRPAPLQVSFAGYPESAGLEAIECRISDRFLEPDAANEGTGKERVHMVDCFYCYDPCGMEMEINPLPAMESGTVTFGCLNNFSKVNERALSLWAQVLGKVKGSRLVISSHAGSHRQRMLEAFEREGGESSRVEFVDIRPRKDYLRLYHRLDIVLDTFPYNGGVTTCDALWMGTPVMSLAGQTPVSRAGVSLLTNAGLPDLIACSQKEYVDIAWRLASDLPRLAELRSTLRDRLVKSAVMDASQFTRQVEQAYRDMWQAWCATVG